MTAAASVAPARSGLRLAVIGLSGAGKSTTAGLIAELATGRGLRVARVPLAAPLYTLQQQVYAAAGVPLAAGAQDQVLLEALADHLRRINPRALVEDFLRRADEAVAAGADVLLNDDLRDPEVDARALRASGFKVLRITCAEPVRLGRLRARTDITSSDRSTARLDRITADAVLDNAAALADHRRAVHRILDGWL